MGIEMNIFCIFIGMIIGLILILIFMYGDNNDKRNNKRKLHNDNNRVLDDITSNRLDWCLDRNNSYYENGKINNVTTMMVLENIKREIPHLLSSTEIDAINKSIENAITVEKLYNFIECKEEK